LFSPWTDLFGWIAVDPNLGAGGGAVICQTGPGQWALMANGSPLCGNWPPATCNDDLVVLFIVSAGCVDEMPVVAIGNFFWTANLPCYEDVWFQRLDLGVPGSDGELPGPPSGCWEVFAHFTPASGWVTPWGDGYPLLDYGVQPGHLYLYRVLARMNGVMEMAVNVLFTGVRDCSDEGGSGGDGGSGGGSSGGESSGGSSSGGGGSDSGGSSGGGSSSGNSGAPILSTDSQLYVACDGAPSGAALQLWLPPLTGALGGMPPVQQAQGWCYVAASPVQTRDQAPDIDPTGFFGECWQCEQSLSQMSSGSVGDGNPGYGSSGGGSEGSGGSSGGDPCQGYGGASTAVGSCACKCLGGYDATINIYSAGNAGQPPAGTLIESYTLPAGLNPDGSCAYSGCTNPSCGYMGTLSMSGGTAGTASATWYYTDGDSGAGIGDIPSDATGCPQSGIFGYGSDVNPGASDADGNPCAIILSSRCGACAQGAPDCPSGTTCD